MSVRVRFAPSPTGHVHIGNIRAAIFNWLFARHEGGAFLLRIEDTDLERSTPEAVRAVLDAMEWLGLDYDEEPLYQSKRREAHRQAAEALLARGHAYWEEKGGEGKGKCVMFRMPGTDMSFRDEIKGELRKEAKDLKDFVIVRSDGSPVFHLANVVDDIEMRITHIMRGDDHIENTYRHVALFEALGHPAPKYIHLPMIVNQQGKPYSKRDGAAFVGDFRENGYLAEALFNYLTLLGWSPGDDREKLSREETIRLFTIERIKSHPAQMDTQKLTHLNGQYLAEMAPEAFRQAAATFLSRQEWGATMDEARLRGVCALLQSRTKTLAQVGEWKCFFTEPDYDEKSVRKLLGREGVGQALQRVREALESESDFAEGAVEAALRRVETEMGFAPGKLNQPVRVAVTGLSTGAGLYETMALLGRQTALPRLDAAARRFCP